MSTTPNASQNAALVADGDTRSAAPHRRDHPADIHPMACGEAR
ncbi:hypothetical protein [Halostreptopolyspora alba]